MTIRALYLWICVFGVLYSALDATAQLAGCETTYVDYSTGTDTNGKLALYAWTTTTDEAVNYVPQGSCTVGSQWSQGDHVPYYHTYSTSISIQPTSGALIVVTNNAIKQSGNTNGTNTVNAMDEDPCFSQDLPGCDGSLN